MSENETLSRVGAKVGRVVSDAMTNTCVVVVERKVKHPLYDKYVRRRTKLLVHDEQDQCKKGDRVLIRQGKPVSKAKRWYLVEIVEKFAG